MEKKDTIMKWPYHSNPIAEYAKVIYQIWDREGYHDAPIGYQTWMEYWQKKYGNKQERSNV